ncbi:putative RNA-binding protein [Trypanosoma grayi]|uniref:putative RNA-binding protein n=1 Tax=Trypanosoma grayi TaxID=71804 RepID=UPI0004F46B06|nr:putative RNA-binding protein [Trypanosoma grayi]KEG15123.1 putative RNA-binding protein [Trypanosoma grayi]
MLDTHASPERPVSPVSSASTAEVTAGHDVSTINRTLDASSIHDDGILMDFGSKHWIRVTQLDPNTTGKALRCMFYPYGGDEAFVLWEEGVMGYVGFENRCMADLAVEKMDAFIPCRQSQALCVAHVSLEEVLFAKSAAPLWGQKGLTSLLYSGCPAHFIAQAIESHRQPCQCAAEVVEEVRRAPRSMMSRVLAAVAKLRQNWVSLEEFREALVRHLLRQIVEDEPTDPKANCGTLLGELFVMGFLTGDPFHLASRILQRGVHSTVQIDSVCAIAHACASMPVPISKASFWALVGQASLQVADPLRADLRAHLRQFQHSTELFSPAPSVTPKNDLSLNRTNKSRHLLPESKSRTVYVSHLPPLLPQETFMNLFMMCGTVSKVRMCRGNGYATLFAFVEMSTPDEAKATLRLCRMNLMGCNIRVQIARNPIQDAQAEDALVEPNSAIIHGCLFGQNGGTLADAAEAGGKSAGR